MKKIEELYALFQKHPKVVTDSRKIEDGCLFFALKGEKFNGNKYAKEAIRKGAAYAIVDEIEEEDPSLFLVEDVLKTLQRLANFHRRKMLIPVIGITGSNGKTTTKELTAAVLEKQYKCHYTKGNLNNHIGVPLTLLELREEHEIAIIEMGANHVGEIDFLCKIAEPTHGIITNIGKAHLEGFGSLEGVIQAKSELYKYIELKNGVVFVNMDEKYLSELSDGITKRVFYEEKKEPAPLEAPYQTILLETEPYLKVGFLDYNHEPFEIQSQLIGLYNFNNLMTAISVGRYFRVPNKKIKQAIEDYVSSNNRSQLVKKGSNTFILDAYNANPTSMKNALENFGKIKAKKKIAVLGDMLELGEYSRKEHQHIVEQAESLELDEIILVGEKFEKATNNRTLHFENVEMLREWFKEQEFEATYFLIKGSRAIRLEKLIS